MPMKISLKNEAGQVIDSVTDTKKALRKLLPNFDNKEYCCLRFIDPYGDTIFNNLQMMIFLDEWNQLLEKAEHQEEKEIMLQIKDLAARCQAGTHLYLWFLGD